MPNFREFEFWKRSRKLSIDIYTLTTSFPKSEQFGLTNQIRRASVSIPSNIAEGASRSSKKDFSRFLEISIGSAHELETQLHIANSINYLKDNDYRKINAELDEITKMISRYRNRILQSTK